MIIFKINQIDMKCYFIAFWILLLDSCFVDADSQHLYGTSIKNLTCSEGKTIKITDVTFNQYNSRCSRDDSCVREQQKLKTLCSGRQTCLLDTRDYQSCTRASREVKITYRCLVAGTFSRHESRICGSFQSINCYEQKIQLFNYSFEYNVSRNVQEHPWDIISNGINTTFKTYCEEQNGRCMIELIKPELTYFYLPISMKVRYECVQHGPDSTEADSTEDESAKPDSTEDESAKPDSTEADSTEDESAIPDSTEDESARPDSTEDESTVPDSTEDDSIGPDSTRPDFTRTDSTGPASKEPDSARPESIGPDLIGTVIGVAVCVAFTLCIIGLVTWSRIRRKKRKSNLNLTPVAHNQRTQMNATETNNYEEPFEITPSYFSLEKDAAETSNYASCAEGVYDVTNDRRHVNDVNIYDHAINDVYDMSNHNSKRHKDDGQLYSTTNNIKV